VLYIFGALVTPSNLVRYYLLLSLQTAGLVLASLGYDRFRSLSTFWFIFFQKEEAGEVLPWPKSSAHSKLLQL
jgi:hypothetical protein